MREGSLQSESVCAWVCVCVRERGGGISERATCVDLRRCVHRNKVQVGFGKRGLSLCLSPGPVQHTHPPSLSRTSDILLLETWVAQQKNKNKNSRTKKKNFMQRRSSQTEFRTRGSWNGAQNFCSPSLSFSLSLTFSHSLPFSRCYIS